MDNIMKIGTREKIEKSIASALFISQKNAEQVFDYLSITYRENASEFGCINQSTSLGQELVFGEGQYYINLPKSIVVVMALLLDITLTKGIISGVCGMLGIQTQVFYNMDQHKGEVCLLREYLRNKKIVDADRYLYLVGKECINNDLECKYCNRESKCCIQQADIERILIYFIEAKITD